MQIFLIKNMLRFLFCFVVIQFSLSCKYREKLTKDTAEQCEDYCRGLDCDYYHWINPEEAIIEEAITDVFARMIIFTIRI